MKEVKISVIIPVYNGQKTIKRCLRSVLSQSLHEIEIICINDGSDDKTSDILRQWSRKDSRVMFIDQDRSNAGNARNQGIKSARGRYLAFMDADDFYPDHNVLEKLYLKAEKSEASICGGSLSKYLNGRIYHKDDTFDRFENEGLISFRDFQWDYGFYRYIFRREFVLSEHLFFPDLSYYEDPVFLLNAMISAGGFYAICDDVYCYTLKRRNFDSWAQKKTVDLANGLLSELRLSLKEDLDLLTDRIFDRINHEYRYAFISSLKKGNGELLAVLSQIDCISKESYGEDYQIDPLRIVNDEMHHKNVSIEKTINKNDMIKNVLMSIRENGLKYTFERILFHLGMRQDNDPERTYSKYE